MKTALLKAVVELKLTENEALDWLQECGVISDLCLRLVDVADADMANAIDALALYRRMGKAKGKR